MTTLAVPRLPLQPWKQFALLAGCLGVAVSTADAATVAHWRFESGSAGANVAHSTAAGVFHGSIEDVSGNGNALSAWSLGGGSGYGYRADVPFTNVPQSGLTNRFSVKNTGSLPALFTSGSSAGVTGIDARTMTPAQFTVEASYKPEANGSHRTVVGRDARNISKSDGNLAAFYLQVRPDDSVAVSFTDVSGFTHSVNSPPGWIYGFNFGSNPNGLGVPWYHLAASSDGTTLRLYVDNILVASGNISSSGSTNRALAAGTVNGSDWVSGAWSVGRGLYGGTHTDRAYGFIDEVRISDTALLQGQLMAVARPRIGNVRISDGTMAVDVLGGMPNTSAVIVQSAGPTAPIAQWATALNRQFDATGKLVFLTPVDPLATNAFFAVRGAVPSAKAGAMSYRLVAGSENWPADIRARIIYAMDGAVATYNRYGTFRRALTVDYHPGVPTAEANFDGLVKFGGQIGYRTALHEIGHTLGVGTHGGWWANLNGGVWTGANGQKQIRDFDGAGANAYSDGTHFWPYGLNYESEGNTEAYRRHVLMVLAFQKDMGLQ